MGFERAGYRVRYMEWAKTVMEAGIPGLIDIGSSGIARISLRELRVSKADLELFGPHFYGEPDLRRRIASFARVGGERVLPTLGASHGHFLACAALIRPGDEVIVETPGYESLSAVPLALGARIVPLPRRFEDGFQFDPDELRRRIGRKTRLILVTNLHNPSGVALAPECLAALAEAAGGNPETTASASRTSDRASVKLRTGGRRDGSVERAARRREGAKDPNSRLHEPPDRRRSQPDPPRSGGAGAGAPDWVREGGRPLDVADGPWVVVNEVYRDFVGARAGPAGHRLGPRAATLGSLTKVYGLGETRVGWVIAEPALLHRASRVNDFGVVNGPYIAERIGAIALGRRARLMARARAIVRRNRPLLARFLEERSGRLETVAPAGGIVVFPRVAGIGETRPFAERALREHGVCVVPGAFFGAPEHIRLGIGQKDPRRLAEGLRRLGDALDGRTRRSG